MIGNCLLCTCVCTSLGSRPVHMHSKACNQSCVYCRLSYGFAVSSNVPSYMYNMLMLWLFEYYACSYCTCPFSPVLSIYCFHTRFPNVQCSYGSSHPLPGTLHPASLLTSALSHSCTHPPLHTRHTLSHSGTDHRFRTRQCGPVTKYDNENSEHFHWCWHTESQRNNH